MRHSFTDGWDRTGVFFFLCARVSLGTFHLKHSAENDEKCKLISITGKVCITSLNSHSAAFHSGTRCKSQSTLLRFGQRTPTNRTHFFSWPNHQVGFALGAFDRVEFDAFNFDSF